MIDQGPGETSQEDAARIEVATIDDLDAIMTLERTCLGGEWSPRSWSDDVVHGQSAGAGVSRRWVGVIRYDGRAVAVSDLALAAETADILRVAVLPSFRRRGWARALLEGGLAWAARHGGETCLLEVEAGNDAAIALYEAMGFAEIARRGEYYGPGRDALVMSRPITLEAGQAADDNEERGIG
ncbi:MAG: GNAT family N-acetyltransferase [Propionibacteriaceae bacterium]|jgi:ribosomal protein S18 acetylase RimI-like enzyme|nr:GNAT family N-acetyltransferase [Propionibacteriaceae bacterium]